MAELPFRILATDRRFFDDHLEEEMATGQAETCSRCGRPLHEDEDDGEDAGVAIRAWPGDARWQVRYHPACLGFKQ